MTSVPAAPPPAPSDPEDVSAYVARAQAAAAVVDDVPADTPLIPVGKVGIVGAGTMGGGIAMAFASAGVPVVIVETAQAALDRGLDTVRRNYERSAERGRFSMDEAHDRFGRIQGGLAFEALADCDLVIEAVYEDMELKKRIFRRLDGVARPGAILATNTSGLDVDAIAAETSRPQDVIGLHFFSPANVMKLLEIVRGARTSRSVVATAMALARRIGKIAVLVGVTPGFVGNRMLHPRQVQAQAMLRRGLAPWDVDRALTGFGFKMGPFQMADLAGLDIGWTPGQTGGDPVRNALCEAGRRGQKTGAGYYEYDAERRPRPSPQVEALLRDVLGPAPAGERPSDEAVVEALIFPMINEAARILEEGKAQRASDIDVVWLYGYGWPQHRGGPMLHADRVGLDRVAARLDALADASGDAALRPAPLLRRLAETGGRFTAA